MTHDEMRKAAKVMVEAFEDLMDGRDLTGDEEEIQKSVVVAGGFAAAAHDIAGDGILGAYALTRAFVIALADPGDARLDYLRAGPAAGQAAREAMQKLSQIQVKGAPE